MKTVLWVVLPSGGISMGGSATNRRPRLVCSYGNSGGDRWCMWLWWDLSVCSHLLLALADVDGAGRGGGGAPVGQVLAVRAPTGSLVRGGIKGWGT